MSTSISSDFGNKHITPGIGRVSNDLVIEKGKGTWVWTTDGKKWLDFTSGIVSRGIHRRHHAKKRRSDSYSVIIPR